MFLEISLYFPIIRLRTLPKGDPLLLPEVLGLAEGLLLLGEEATLVEGREPDCLGRAVGWVWV